MLNNTLDTATRSTRPRGAATIERAITAACEIVDERGEVALRIVEVSRRSHVSIGALYHHFGSRDGLVDAAREHEFLEGLAGEIRTDADQLMHASTVQEFIERFDEVLLRGDDPRWATVRGRRFEIIGSIAARPGTLAGVVDSQVAYLDALERIARSLHGRGWLAEGIEPRAFALFLHAASMARVLRDVDDRVSREAWRRVVRASLRGLLSDGSTASCRETTPDRPGTPRARADDVAVDAENAENAVDRSRARPATGTSQLPGR